MTLELPLGCHALGDVGVYPTNSIARNKEQDFRGFVNHRGEGVGVAPLRIAGHFSTNCY